MGLRKLWKWLKLSGHYDHVGATINSIPFGRDTPKMPADQIMDKVRSVTESSKTTELFDFFAPKEQADTKPMQRVAGEMALFLKSVSGRMPSDAVMEMTDHILKNSNTLIALQKYPKLAIETFINLVENADPTDHLDILAKIDRSTILRQAVGNSPEGSKSRAADFFIKIVHAGQNEDDFRDRFARVRISPAFRDGLENYEFYDQIRTLEVGS